MLRPNGRVICYAFIRHASTRRSAEGLLTLPEIAQGIHAVGKHRAAIGEAVLIIRVAAPTTVGEADAIKLDWETNHSFKLKFASFSEKV